MVGVGGVMYQMKQWGSERGWVFYAELQGRKDVIERGNVIEDRGLFYFIEDLAVRRAPPEMDILQIIIVTTNANANVEPA